MESYGKPTGNITLINSFKYCSVCRMVTPVFKFFDDEVQEYKTFCKICFYNVDIKSEDREISQLNLTAGYMNDNE